MDKINAIDGKRFYKIKDKFADLNKTNYNNKKANYKDNRFGKDRGDSNQFRNSREKIENKTQQNNLHSRVTNLIVPSKIEKKDVNIQDTERKRDKDKNSKTRNLLDRRYETKSKNILDTKDDNKDHSKARDDIKNISHESKPNIKMDNTSHQINKRPLIRTITDTHDATKTYKAVTFTERKPQRAIKIKIPNINNVKKTNIPKLVNRHQRNKIDGKNNVEDNVISKSKSKFDKKIKHRRELVSPVRERNGVSPPTEIAKWAPNSITDHTRPYYEAWINTTLSAICSKKDGLYLDKKKIWKTFQQTLDERSYSPELIYENFADERFTGKIRINHR
ncbi:MATH and LRR domain-containing protein PFE0570w-like [Vanessa atalanta]|uniref:MATH and LRR domain-containing protein PFE0570w-like n=1 Tax=Vanessa atalanta TaxID=42275 RepID=UPI001FCD0A80|nr:MATH and LRR domain-containing protein PFE0570w-like [Vanessa atalanta]